MNFLMSRATLIGNRVSKSLPNVALAATTLVAGASMLSGGEAQAFNCTFGGTSPTCITGSWHASNPASDKLIKFLNLPSTGSGDIEFNYVDDSPAGLDPNDQWFVDVTFHPTNLMHSDGISTFDYLIKIDPLAVPRLDVFKDVNLSALVGGDASLSKEIWATNGSGTKTTLLHTLKYDPFNGITDIHYDVAPSNGLSELYILDTANAGTVVNGGNVQRYVNTFRQAVPGPLPLLGAGAAFSFTRKLRRRVKTFRMA
jgi:hypothetical protein